MRWIALCLLTAAIVLGLGVLFQSDLRGGLSSEEVATRYVAAMRGGDRVTLFLLSHPNATLSATIDARVTKYRSVVGGRVAFRYEPHSVAAYFVTVIITVDDAPFDTLGLEYQGRRWYIVRLGD